MSTIIARCVAATPVRTASATWAKIAALLAPDADGPARDELIRVSGVACSAIASEAPKTDPVVVYGGGPRVRVYCVFNDEAITGDGLNEDALSRSPTGEDWRMSIAFPQEDLTWARAELARLSTRVSARSVGETVSDEGASANHVVTTGSVDVDAQEFNRP